MRNKPSSLSQDVNAVATAYSAGLRVVEGGLFQFILLAKGGCPLQGAAAFYVDAFKLEIAA
jgi:hypothetical protein